MNLCNLLASGRNYDGLDENCDGLDEKCDGLDENYDAPNFK